MSLLFCTRRWTRTWLPWRLGRFLDCCWTRVWLPWRLGRFLTGAGAGLVRGDGIAYQFRHRELQDYLARPQPVPATSAPALASLRRRAERAVRSRLDAEAHRLAGLRDRPALPTCWPSSTSDQSDVDALAGPGAPGGTARAGRGGGGS